MSFCLDRAMLTLLPPSTYSSTLIIAAMDTTSAALSRILYLLSQNPDVQDKLRAELTRAREESGSPIGEMDYNQLQALPYLDAVCRESLRVCVPLRRSAESLIVRVSN